MPFKGYARRSLNLASIEKESASHMFTDERSVDGKNVLQWKNHYMKYSMFSLILCLKCWSVYIHNNADNSTFNP